MASAGTRPVNAQQSDLVELAEPRLKQNAVGTTGAVIMSAALMGPAVSVYFNPQLAAGFAGAAVPFVFVIALIAVAIAANGLGEMARKLPSAGAFYTYVSRGIGPRTGFVTGLLMFVAYSLLVPAELALIGSYLHDILLRTLHLEVHWAFIALFFALLTYALSLVGIQGSLRTALVLFTLEVAIILILSVVILAKGGAHGITAQPFNPASSPQGISGIMLGSVFAILSFVGFEGAATLGEEAKEPRKTVPRAIMGSLGLVACIYIIATFSEMIGFGVHNIAKLTGDAAPFDTLATTYLPGFRIFVDLAGVSSIFAVIMNTHNGIVRIIFAMGREGLLPRGLGGVNRRFRTPHAAIVVQSIISIVVALVVGFWVGPLNAYAYLGAMLTLGIVPVYILVNIACIRFYRREYPREASLVRHTILPILGCLLMLIPIYGSVWPIPAAPYNYFPYILIVYIGVGILIAAYLARTRPDTLRRAGAMLAEGDLDTEPARA
jgi:amino acid transporter